MGCQDSSARMSHAKSARTSLVNSARMCLAKSATTFPDRSAETFLDSSASTFPSKCATPPSRPTAESEDLKRELMKTRNQAAAEELPEAPKRRFNLLSKLPGWSQRSYLFLFAILM